MSFKHLKYYPELNKVTGSINATIVLLQLEYWSSKSKGDKFYKFLDACEHEGYKPGDSWAEELGFTKHEFRTAFAKIGKVYKSKKEFKASKDLFEGKYYASYYDRMKGLTYYIRNNEALNKLFSIGEKANLEKSEDKISVNQETSSPISVENNKLLQSVKHTQHAKSDVPYETLKELFNTSCSSYPKVTELTEKRKNMLQKLWHSMGQSLESFKKAFLLAEASDFLSGRIGTWRASFDWLIQEDKFIALLEGNYACTCNAHSSVESKAKTAIRSKFTNMYSHNWDFEELEALENTYIDEKINRLKLAATTVKGVYAYE